VVCFFSLWKIELRFFGTVDADDADVYDDDDDERMCFNVA